MSLKILYKFASRSRPDKFFTAIENICDFSVGRKFKILASLDFDDPQMNNTEVIKTLKIYNKLTSVFGYSKGKLDAVNRDMEYAGGWDIAVVMSDDMKFVTYGFDNIIRRDMEKYFPTLDGVLHYPDGVTGDHIITMSILGRKYYERFGYFYHPSYVSLWADNEFTQVAQQLGKYKYIPVDIYKHLHPAWGLSEKDTLMIANESHYYQDQKTFQKRKKQKFKA